MKINLITFSKKAPVWIQSGFEYYLERLSPYCKVNLIELKPEKRAPHISIENLLKIEGEKMLSSTKPHHFVLALDIKGKLWNTLQLSTHLSKWQHQSSQIDILIGSADGLSADCLKRANETWSLSPLTFPHLLVRIILIEQVYRAFSLLNNHPYHRE